MKKKALFKYNGGHGALLCSCCARIIKVGRDFSEEEIKAAYFGGPDLPPAYCYECKNKNT